jgi:hypothetical protein
MIMLRASQIGDFTNEDIYRVKGLEAARRSDVRKMRPIADLIRTLCKQGYLGKREKGNVQDPNTYFLTEMGQRWMQRRKQCYIIKRFMCRVFG